LFIYEKNCKAKAKEIPRKELADPDVRKINFCIILFFFLGTFKKKRM